MNDTTLVGLASSIALVGTTLYWRRRERTVRESLTVSRDWESNTNDVDRETQRAARKAAERLDARVEDLPDRVTALDDERRDLRRELDAVRARWADSWWGSLSDDRSVDGESNGDDPTVRVVEFADGELPDARALAKRAMDGEGITLVVAHGDGSFAVAVDEALADEFSATAIGREIADEAGGGAGGNDRLAAGGGATDALGETAERVRKRLLRTGPLAPA